MNDLDQNPWRLDTAVAGLNLTTLKWRGKVIWTSEAGADGDSLILEDRNGKRIFEAHHDGTADTYTSDGVIPEGGPGFDGLVVNTLSSGEVKVYYT